MTFAGGQYCDRVKGGDPLGGGKIRKRATQEMRSALPNPRKPVYQGRGRKLVRQG